jgi:hypothetical protein
VRVINRSGATLARGSLQAFDLAAAGDTANYTVGDDLSIFVSTVDCASDIAGWFCICFSDTSGNVAATPAANAEYIAVIRGVTKALVQGGDDAALADWLIPDTTPDNQLLSDAGTAGEKIIGKPLEVTTGGGSAELIDILFNGIEGFGAMPDQA